MVLNPRSGKNYPTSSKPGRPLIQVRKEMILEGKALRGHARDNARHKGMERKRATMRVTEGRKRKDFCCSF